MGSKNRGSMDPVHILMDPVHGPVPRRGSMFCTFPLKSAFCQNGKTCGVHGATEQTESDSNDPDDDCHDDSSDYKFLIAVEPSVHKIEKHWITQEGDTPK